MLSKKHLVLLDLSLYWWLLFIGLWIPQALCEKGIALKAAKVNWRTGPGYEHEVIWIYQCPGWPVVIEKKCEHWYLVRDYDGTRGWVHAPMLLFKPMVLVRQDMVPLRKNPKENSMTLAYLRKGFIGQFYRKEQGWCLIGVKEKNIKGWVPSDVLWPSHE